MEITVGRILQTEEFSDFKVICGRNGLDRKVSAVSVMDAPDIYEWLQGGEILLTSGYLLKNNLDFVQELIEKISQKGAAALFIKFGRFIDDIPEAAKKKADQLAFPVVFMPYKRAFVDVITPVLTKVNSRQLEIIRKSEKIHCVFTNIAIRQEGIGKVLEYLMDLLGREVAFLDNTKERVFYSREGMFLDMDNYMQKYSCFPIQVGRKMYGYIIVNESDFMANEYDLIAIEHASTIIKLEIQREISNDEIERKYRDNLVLDIIYNNINNEDELRERGSIFGWDFEGALRVMIADIDHFKENYEKGAADRTAVDELARQILDTISTAIKLAFGKMVFTTFTDRAVFLLWDEGKGHDEMKRRLAGINENIISRKGFSLTFAIGGLVPDIRKAHQSYEEAKMALALGRKLGWEHTSFFYNQLGFYRLLDQLRGNPAVQGFFQDKLRCVEEYDCMKNGELYETLFVLMECNWNLREASEKLFIHYNTMKNRYHRLEEVMGISLDSMEERMELEFAVKSQIVNGI